MLTTTVLEVKCSASRMSRTPERRDTIWNTTAQAALTPVPDMRRIGSSQVRQPVLDLYGPTLTWRALAQQEVSDEGAKRS